MCPTADPEVKVSMRILYRLRQVLGKSSKCNLVLTLRTVGPDNKLFFVRTVLSLESSVISAPSDMIGSPIDFIDACNDKIFIRQTCFGEGQLWMSKQNNDINRTRLYMNDYLGIWQDPTVSSRSYHNQHVRANKWNERSLWHALLIIPL